MKSPARLISMLFLVLSILPGCANKTAVVFAGTAAPSVLSPDEVKIVTRIDGDLKELGTVTATCKEKTASTTQGSQGSVETCNETDLSAVLAKKVAEVGGTHMANIKCEAELEDTLKGNKEKPLRDGMEKYTPFAHGTVKLEVKCRATVGRDPRQR